MADQKPNFGRMLQLIDEVFSTRHDPDQIQVNAQELEKLKAIHPATLTEIGNDQGPITWLLMIPTTSAIMNGFLNGSISEKALLEQTQPGGVYDCLYLCSVSTLPEFRGKGETKKLCLKAIEVFRAAYPVNTLFVWPFSAKGEELAECLAQTCGLRLLKKTKD